MARTADLFLGLRPGTDSALLGAHAARAHRARLARSRLHPRPHRRLRRGRRARSRDHTPNGPSDHRDPGGSHRAGRGVVGHGQDRRCCCTPAASSTRPRASRTCWAASTSASPPASTASRAAASRPSPGRATARAGASTATSATSSRATATSPIRSTGPTSPSVWGCEVDEIPGKGLTAEEIVEAIHRGEIKGLLSICFNPVVSLPDTAFTKEALDKLEFYAVIDFFLSETAFHADLVLPGSLHEEDEGTSTNVEGRVIKLNPSKTPPGNARLDWQILCDLAAPARQGPLLPVRRRRADLRGAAGRVQGRQRRLLRHHLGAHRAASWASSGPVPPRTTRARRACSRAAASTPTTAEAASTLCATARRPRWSTTSTRCGSPRAAWSASTCPAPRPGASARSSRSTRSRCARSTRGWPTQHGIADGDLVRVDVPAGIDDAAGQSGGDDPARHDLHPVPLGRTPSGQPAHQPSARPAFEDP